MKLSEVESEFRRYEVNSKVVECETPSCSGCPYLAACKASDKEALRYRPDVRSFGAELHERATILPYLDTNSELVSRKLYQVLIEMMVADRLKKRINAFELAKNLGISTFKVRKRLEYLVEHHFVKINKKGTYEFSFGRNTHSMIQFYSTEFARIFGSSPRIDPADAGVLSPLIKEYSDADLRRIITSYLELSDDKFLKDVGYQLRFLPSKINRLLIDLAAKIPQKSGTLTREQLQEYLAGKKEGKWTGTEPWAKSYESAISAVQVEA